MKLIIIITTTLLFSFVYAQQVPAQEENIPYLVTFGKDAEDKWGDDDHSQVFFIIIPKTFNSPFYVRVFDPDVSGKIDEVQGGFNSSTRFDFYGGKGCISNEAARSTDPVKGYDSGNLLTSKVFSTEYDNKWYSFGPFNPTSGERSEKYGGNVIKLIISGVKGNDGNLYKLFISTSNTANIPVEGSNTFTFEYSFRMHDNPREVSHVYPYIDGKTVSVKQSNFDWDLDGELKFITKYRAGVYMKKSGDGSWTKSEHKVLSKEKESTFDVQFHKNQKNPTKNNNVVFNITNQYGEYLPFFSVPIGGVPKPKAKMIVLPGKK